MKTPEELAISMWNKGGHGLDLEEVVAIITADRKDLMSEVVENAYKKGYVDGFLKTGEGYNGEYMQGAKDRHNVTVEDVFATLSTEDILTEARNIIKFK